MSVPFAVATRVCRTIQHFTQLLPGATSHPGGMMDGSGKSSCEVDPYAVT